MTIQLSPAQQRWWEAQVAAGHFASLEQAVAELERGEGVRADEAMAQIQSALDRQR
jgi:hypothetical protein